MPSVAEILIAQGREIAEYRRRQGERRAAVVAGLGQMPGQIMADRQAQQVAQRRAAIEAEELQMRRNTDARADEDLRLRQAGFDADRQEANKRQAAQEAQKIAAGGYDHATGLQWIHSRTGTLWSPEKGAQLLAQSQTPEGFKRIIDFIAPLAPPTPVKTREIRRRNPDGSETIEIVEDKPGFSTTSEPEPEKPETYAPGSLADDIARYAAENGKTVAQVTGREINKIRADRAAAERAPQKVDGAPEDQRRARLVDAVLANASLWDDLTPTVKGDIAADLANRGFSGFGRRLSDGAIATMANTRAAIKGLQDLRTTLQENEQYIGPIAGLQGLNPYSDARKAQAKIDTVRQRVGKALEGGVLRKEDEEKYKKILATLRDEPTTAIFKVDNLIATLERDLEIYIEEQRAAGRRVAASSPSATPRSAASRTRVVPPSMRIRARDPQGNLHEAVAGTPLPPGWTRE